MTLAVASSASSSGTVVPTVPIVVLGTDALLAASPATPVQIAHACLSAGYANVIPASWGDELIAAAVLRRLPQYGANPVIQCSCPIVAHRLLSVGGDLRNALLPLVPPPVAIARYVRVLSQPTRTRITYVGTCPGATDESIDIRMRPDAFFAMLAEREIRLDDQPRVFESIIPPDRRRFRSQPGGVPTPDVLWTELGARALVEIESEDVVSEIAQHLLTGKNVLIDVSARMGCACAGASAHGSGKEARTTVTSIEPPRATTPVVDEQAPIELDLPIPAVPRTPVDVMAVPPNSAPRVTPQNAGSTMLGHRISPVRPITSTSEPRPSRASAAINPRPVLGALPVAKDTEGRSLPRTYVARRRSSPKGFPAITLASEEVERPSKRSARASSPLSVPSSSDTDQAVATPPVAAPAVSQQRASELPAPPAPSAPQVVVPPTPSAAPVVSSGSAQFPTSLTTRQLLYIIAAIVLLTLSVSTIVAVVVGRSLRQPAPIPATTTEGR